MTRLKLRHAMLGIAVVAELLAIYTTHHASKRASVAEVRWALVNLHDTNAWYRRNSVIGETLCSETSAELAEKWAKLGRPDRADHYRQATTLYAAKAARSRELARYSEQRAAELAAMPDLDSSAEKAKDRMRDFQEYSHDKPLNDAYARVIYGWSSQFPQEDLAHWEAMNAKGLKMMQVYRGSPGPFAR